MRLPRNEGRWGDPEFATDGRHKSDPESTTCSLDVARGWNDGVSIFFLTGSLVDLQREFRRSCNGAELRRGCFWRCRLFARTSKLSTLARSLTNCDRCCTGFFGQELTAYGLSLRRYFSIVITASTSFRLRRIRNRPPLGLRMTRRSFLTQLPCWQR